MNRLRTLIALSLLLIAQAVSAQALPGVIAKPGVIDPRGADAIECNFTTGKLPPACIPLFIGHLIELVFGLVSIFFILNVIFAGYQLAIGAWSGEKSKGKDRLIWSIIGLIICAGAFLILDVVLNVVVG